jgi:hypothetical protein
VLWVLAVVQLEDNLLFRVDPTFNVAFD